DVITYFFRLRLMNDRGNHAANLTHLRLFHPARRYGRSADTQSRSYEGLVLIERNGVLVDGDLRSFERLLSVLTGDALAVHPHVDEHEVIVCAAGNDAQALLLQFGAQRFRVRENLPLIFFEVIAQRLAKRHRFRCDDMYERTALNSGKESPIDFLC